MARLNGPLFSLGAAGQLGKALVYADWKGIPYARTYVIPENPNSANQQEVRGIFKTLTEMWKRMPQLARDPFQAFVRGKTLTDRNAHIQASALALKNQANLNALVMSKSSGSSVPPASWEATGGVKTITLTPVAPELPVGYTLTSMIGAAVKDGDPSPFITRDTFVGFDETTPYSIAITTLEAGVHQWGVWCKFTRTSDSKIFYSEALRGQATTT